MIKEKKIKLTKAFNGNEGDWNKCIDLLKGYWNTDYGTFEVCKEKDGTTTVELTTGGWSENEYLIDVICDTWFWFLFWQESKRGGYYKFIFVDKITYDESEDKQ